MAAVNGAPDSLQQVLRVIDQANLRPGGWDAPPQVWLVSVDPADDSLSAERVSVFDEVVSAVNTHGGGPPAVMLDLLARWFAEGLPDPHPPVEAAVFACEAWLVKTPPDDPEAAKDVEREALARKLHARPDRIEVRQLVSVDRHRGQRALSYPRTNDTEVTELSTADVSSEEMGLTGDIVSGLQHLVGIINLRAARG